MFRLFILLVLINLANTDIVEWKATNSFNLPKNFDEGRLPCSKQTVVFPDELEAALDIEADMSINGLVLPNDGEIFFDDISLFFGPDSNETCSEDGNVEYNGQTLSSWDEPDVWSSPRFNKATPDAERIPCFDDVVVFPKNKQILCQLPEKTQIIRELRVGTKVYKDFSSLSDDFDNDFYNYILLIYYDDSYKDSVNVLDSKCSSKVGCSCQPVMMEPNCLRKYCPVPSCVAPIKPIGNCCKICGGTLVFDINESSFILATFRKFVKKIIDSYPGLIYHIGRIGDKVQLVVVEAGDYEGRSAEAVNEIRYLMEKGWVVGEEKALLSGTPIYKYGLGAKLFVSMFFLVAFAMGLVYGYYYKLPDIRYPAMVRSWLNFGALARFQRRSESVVSLTRRDSVASGFRNPLYNSRRERVHITESSLEE